MLFIHSGLVDYSRMTQMNVIIIINRQEVKPKTSCKRKLTEKKEKTPQRAH